MKNNDQEISLLNSDIVSNTNLIKDKLVDEIHLFKSPKIIGSKGKIEADLNKQMIVHSIGKRVIIKKFNYKRNEIFLKEAKYFLSCIKKK